MYFKWYLFQIIYSNADNATRKTTGYVGPNKINVNFHDNSIPPSEQLHPTEE